MNRPGKKETKARTAFVYSDRLASFDYGESHPMKPERLRLTRELIEALGLGELPSSEFIEARSASIEELLLFHTPGYLKILKEADSGIIPPDGAEHGLGYSDNPVFKGVFEWSALCAGASLQAAELVASGKADIAFNISGGLHHAMPERASGFCYINDAAIAIKYLAGLGKRVAYVDIDAHHGDGVEAAFYDTDAVLTVSVHESGEWLFPGTGAVADIGTGAGRGFSVNVPLPPFAGDELFLKAMEEVVLPVVEAFSPDILVTQLGVDTFDTDPITHLRLTTGGFEKALSRFRSMKLPWVALGGGGYDIGNVARAWTLAWAIMNDVVSPDIIPEDFLRRKGSIFRNALLRDKPIVQEIAPDEKSAFDAEINCLKKTVLPLIRRSVR
ncbi:MAG: acetoin utilization protein AcuC [Deltaproteobacteria bacterium]|nr:acetoin utilization protein AcuC [Deltaproteobacteria bacterium]